MSKTLDLQVHPCFRLDITFPLTISNHGNLLDLWQSLSYRIMRKPDDLLAHTRRIRLCHEPALNDRLAGALHDLDFALDGAGAALRERLQREARPYLSHQIAPPGQTGSGPMHTPVKGQTLPTLPQLLQRAESGPGASLQ